MLVGLQIEYWTISWPDTEAIELMWENGRFAKEVGRVFEGYSSEEDVPSIGGQKPGFWLNGEVSGPTTAQIYDMVFSWWSRPDLVT